MAAVEPLQPMKMVEALKRLNLVLKRMEAQCGRVTDSASRMSVEVPPLGSDDAHIDKLKSLVQSNLDLAEEYLALKRAIDKTNLSTLVTIDDQTYTITDLLNWKRKVGAFVLKTFKSLDDKPTHLKIQQWARVSGDPVPTVVRYFDETAKFQELDKWQSFLDQINGKLEVVNAVTDLIPE